MSVQAESRSSVARRAVHHHYMLVLGRERNQNEPGTQFAGGLTVCAGLAFNEGRAGQRMLIEGG